MPADEDSPFEVAADEHDENAPLLSKAHGAGSQETPLPRAQLAAIYFIKLTIPVVYTQVQPYLNKMISELDLPPGRPVGYYSGLLGLAINAGQFLTVFPWGRLSDWLGRTRIITFGLFGLVLSTVAFGLSQTFAQALFFRLLTGVFSGYVGVIHSVVGELSDATNQSTAFPFYDIISALGYIVGPILGGAFADPATELPKWFDYPFWRKYPYSLPCLISGAIGTCASLLSLFYLKETHPRFSAKKTYDMAEQTSSYQSITVPSSPDADEDKPPTVRSLFALPVIRAICTSQFVIGFLASSFNTVFVLLAYTSIDQGGLSMKPLRIAFALSIMGFVSIGLKASLPIFLKRYDTLTVYRSTVKAFPITYALIPFLNIIARATGPHRSTVAEALLWVSISVVLLASRIGTLAFGIIMILTKDHTPTFSALGTTNSISELAQMAGISIGAPFVSKILGGHLWVVIYCVLATVADLSARRIAQYRR
ncbi:MFS general substrate transporter [Irpex rosettiformis]|uniref:MFS general substrate transporter n=1 Tax=Irpex rosettiformis TaxID=378272 RepID=A0ACB8TTP7_9APHY|nr:MFS general substrate transporter [Irpex rosettiformis]